jgi:hypothetical protein
MKCERCRALLDEYIDGELDRTTAAAIATHTSICVSCRAEYQSLLQEQEIYAGYQREIEISPALWTSVKAGIEREKAAGSRRSWSRLRGWFGGGLHTPLMSPAWVAALVIAAVGITVLVMVYINGRTADDREVARQGTDTKQAGPREDRKPESAPPAPQPNTTGSENGPGKSENIARATEPKPARQQLRISPAQPTAAQLVRQAEEKYLAAIALLSRDVDKNRSQIDPATTARFEEALTSINRTIADTRRAVREHPGDPVAAQYMLMAYAEKVDVLKEMAGAQ